MVSFGDDFAQEKIINSAVWRAALSDGRVVIQDDGTPYHGPESAWLRLKDFVKENNLDVVDITLGFRDNIIRDLVPKNADGYFFTNNLLGFVDNGYQAYFYIFGWLENGVVYTKKYKTPELILFEVSKRTIEECNNGIIYASKYKERV